MVFLYKKCSLSNEYCFYITARGLFLQIICVLSTPNGFLMQISTSYMKNIINVKGLCHEILRTVDKDKYESVQQLKCDILSNQIFISITLYET